MTTLRSTFPAHPEHRAAGIRIAVGGTAAHDLEALLSEGEKCGRAMAEDSARDDDDRGDWLYEQRKDRES